VDSEAGFDPRPGQLSAAAQVCALVREYETGAAQGDGSRASRAAARARARLPSPRPFPSSPCARSSPRTGLRSCSRLCPLPSLTARARTTRRSPRAASRRCSTRPVGQGLIARESWGPEPRTGMVFSCFAGIGGQESQGPGHRREQAPPCWCLATIRGRERSCGACTPQERSL